MTISVRIPFKLPGLNEYTLANRSNAFSGASMKKDTETAILWEIKSQIPHNKKFPIKEPVFIYFKWQEAGRRRDKDNIAFAKKFILDALVESGILADDGWDSIDGFEDTFTIGSSYAVDVDIEV